MGSSTQAKHSFPWILLFAVVILTAAAGWQLSSEMVRPSQTGFPVNDDYREAAKHRDQSKLAAWLGMVRGDLFAELFYSYADSLLEQNGRDFGSISTLNEALPAAERALRYAPHQGAVWLLLADMVGRYELAAPDGVAALKMSYYTVPYNAALTATRLSVATRTNALSDADISQFVDRDLRMILTTHPQLRPAIVTAHASASTQGKHFIERIVGDVDASFLASLRGAKPR
jgi:hypothetical protein